MTIFYGQDVTNHFLGYIYIEGVSNESTSYNERWEELILAIGLYCMVQIQKL